MIDRPSWDSYFMSFARLAASRSTCLRRKVGAVLVKDRHVLATGYNGVPRGLAHPTEVGCLRERLGVPSGKQHELCRGLHAEQNAIIQAAYHGVSIRGSVVYCTNQPCSICSKMLINAGVVRIVFEEPYEDQLARDILAETDIEVHQLEEGHP